MSDQGMMARLEKLEASGALYQWLAKPREEPVLRYVIKSPSGRNLTWEAVQDLADQWKNIPAGPGGKPLFSVEYTNKRCGPLGTQRMPVRAVVAGAAEAFALLRMKGRAETFLSELRQVREAEPALASWFLTYYVRIRKEGFFPVCLAIARYFRKERKGGRFQREFSIEGADTKVLERHSFLVRSLWNAVYPEEPAANREELQEKLAADAVPVPAVGVRFLDRRMSCFGARTFFLSLEEAAHFTPDVAHVFILENKVNGYTFPEAEGSVAFFGMGYGVAEFARQAAPWLAGRHVWYWGDLDNDGFLILSHLRQVLPQVRSFLMTEEILRKYLDPSIEDRSGTEDIPQYLTVREKSLWHTLRDRHWRLEQERIPREEAERAVDNILFEET